MLLLPHSVHIIHPTSKEHKPRTERNYLRRYVIEQMNHPSMPSNTFPSSNDDGKALAFTVYIIKLRVIAIY